MENIRKYDVIIVGASTTGSWFGNEMAKRGFKAVKDLSASKTSYTVGSLKSGTCYYFTIKAYAKTPDGRVYSKAAPVKYAYAL